MGSLFSRLFRSFRPIRKQRVQLGVHQLEDRVTPSTLIPVTTRRDLVFDNARQLLYITTSTGRIERYDVASQTLLAPWTVGTSLNAADLSLDGNFLYVGEAFQAGQSRIHKVNLTTGAFTDIVYNTGDSLLGGAYDLAITGNGKALVSTSRNGSASAPMLVLDTATDTLAPRLDVPGIFFGNVNEEVLIDRSADRSTDILVDTAISPASYFTYDSATDRFPGPYNRRLGSSLGSRPVSINRDGSMIAIGGAGTGPTVIVYDRNLNFIHGLDFSIVGSANSRGFAFAPNHDLMFAAYSGLSTVTTIAVIDTNTWTHRTQIQVGEALGTHAVLGTGTMTASADGQWLFVSTAAGVRAIDLTAAPRISINDATTSEGGNATFTVALDRTSTQPVTVDWATTDGGTATPGTDYIPSSGRVTIPAGSFSQTFSVKSNVDRLLEPAETVLVDLSNASATLTRTQVQATINASNPVIHSSNLAVLEGDAGTTDAVFTLQLLQPGEQPVTVNYTTRGVSATAGSDFLPVAGTITFNPGETLHTVTVPIVGETVEETRDEIFYLDLTSPGTALLNPSVEGRIVANDHADTTLPTLSIADVDINEQSGGGTFLVPVTVTLSQASSQAVSVFYASSYGTAIAPDDYLPVNRTLLTFNPGETQKTINVSVLRDSLDEFDEQFALLLQDATGAVLAGPTATITIRDDDTAGVWADNPSIIEGDDGTRTATFLIRMIGSSIHPISLDYATADGTADGSDYTPVSGTVTFNPGQTEPRAIQVQILGDIAPEAHETFFLDLFNAVNAEVLAGQRATATILDDEGPRLTIDDASGVELDPPAAGEPAPTPSVQFAVRLSQASAQPVTVNYTTANFTASSVDYTGSTGTITFAPGETQRTLSIPVTTDRFDEINETFNVFLSNVVGAVLVDGQAVGTIVDDDTALASINSSSAAEGLSMTFTVTLSTVSTRQVRVMYGSRDGSALQDSDYQAVFGQLTFNPGEQTKTFTVSTGHDTRDEPDESFAVHLTDIVDAGFGTQVGTGLILDNDTASVSIADVSRIEGSSTGVINFTISMSTPSDLPVTVSYATANGTAIAGEDYVAATGSVTFNPGETAKSIQVATLGDAVHETDETFAVNLTSTQPISDAQAIGTIVDDDSSFVNVSDSGALEGNSGTATASFTISLTRVSAIPVTFNYATAPSTASAAVDYVSASGSLTFAPGETQKTVAVSINGDTIDELNETFSLNLSGITGASAGDVQGQATIFDDDTSSLAVSDPNVIEGNSGSINLLFSVTLSTANSRTVTVQYATANNTAASGSDYTATSGTLTFNPGETQKTVPVPVLGDTAQEGNETLFLDLTSPTEAVIGDSRGVGTIVNDDAPSLRIADALGAEGTGVLTFVVTLTEAVAHTVTVDYATSNIGPGAAEATAGVDYVATSGRLTFDAGQTQQTIAVSLSDDSLNEVTELFNVDLSNPVGAPILDGRANGFITDDDPSTLSINDITLTEGNTGTVEAVFTLTLSNPSVRTTRIDYATQNGTAVAGADYQSATGSVTFNPGETSKTITILVNGDIVDEVDETFSVQLINNWNASVADGLGSATIVDDDAPQATLRIADFVNVIEGNSGTVAAEFAVTLSHASPVPVTVAYATENGSAAAGVDYQATSGTLSFAPGELVQTITVLVNGDALDELGETYLVHLSAPTNASIESSMGVGAIEDDDTARLFIDDPVVTEGNTGATTAVFNITLTNQSDRTITVNYATSDQGALAGTDYQAASGTLTFAPGETAKSVAVTVFGDAFDEDNEMFVFTLSNAANGFIGDPTGVAVIVDDDPAPTLSVATASVVEGDSGTSLMVFTLTLSSPSNLGVTVTLSTANGSAAADSDYVQVNPFPVSIAPGETSKTFSVFVYGDVVDEANETFTLNLSNPINATLGTAQATGTIVDNDSAAFSVSDVQVTEGDAGAVGATFIVSLSRVADHALTIDYATVSGSAVGGSDFVAASGTLTFNPGQQSQAVIIAVLGDTIDEDTETFALQLANAGGGATIADASGTGTVLDNDTVAVSIADAGATEGDSGSTAVTFTVNLSTAADRPVEMFYTTSPGTATAGSDYLAQTGSLSFAPGETQKSFALPVLGDTLDELDETFTVTLRGVSGGPIPNGSAIATIVDDDTARVSIADTSVNEGNSGTRTALFSVTLSTLSDRPVSVSYVTADGSATAGLDYTAASGTLTIAAGQSSATLTVTTLGDTLDELDETLRVNLSGYGAIADDQGVATILDDDTAALRINSPVSVTEGDTGSVTASFTVTLATTSDRTVTVAYQTADGTASAGSDYQATGGVLSFAPGETAKTISVLVNGDAVDEADENFSVGLSSPTNAPIEAGQATGTIVDDDALAQVSVGDVTVVEGNAGSTNAVFTLTLDQASGKIIQVDYATLDGSARAGLDYTATSGSVFFQPGELSRTVAVPVLGDLLDEADETFRLMLQVGYNVGFADPDGLATITDDDDAPALSVSDVTVTEGDTGTSAATFTVSLSSASGQPVSVSYNTAPGSALAGVDFVSASSALSFAPGETSKTVSIDILGDQLDEDDEAFTLGLASAFNATIADGQGLATILDNDAAPAVSVNDASVGEGHTGTGVLVFVVSLATASGRTVTINYSTANSSATAGSDYEATSGSVTIFAGQLSRAVTVVVHGDTTDEIDETMVLQLTSATNGTIADGQGAGTILDDDDAPSLSIDDRSIVEGAGGAVAATFTVTLSALSGKSVSVNYATASGTASAGSDFSAAAGTLTFAPGETQKTIAVLVNGDTVHESNETFAVELSAPTSATLSRARGTGTIVNDDSGTLTVALNPASIAENGGVTTGTVTRGNTQALDVPLVVTLLSSDTSEATVPVSVTIPAGQASATFTVTAVDDTLVDGPQTLTISASAAGFSSGSASLTVTDNDRVEYTSALFDFGTATSPLAAGALRVTPTTSYSSQLGYGWTGGTIAALDRGAGTNDSRRDFNYTQNGTFAVNVVNGTYSVTITMGDAQAARDKMAISLEGTRVDTVNTKAGQFYTKTFSVRVLDGQLTLDLSDLGGKDAFAVINSLQLTRTGN